MPNIASKPLAVLTHSFLMGLMTALIISYCWGFATASLAQNEPVTPLSSLVTKTSNGFIPAGRWKLGPQSEYGVTDAAAVGVELSSLLAGATNIYGRGKIWQAGRQSLTLGVDLVHMDRDTLLWGAQRDNFAELNVTGVHPRLVFSHAVSSRLIVHSSWEGGSGRGEVKLSEAGKRELWQRKYPQADYDSRDTDGRPTGDDGSRGQENYSIAHRSLLLQSLLGLAQERFEVTGEIQRTPTETLVLAAHVARFNLADLRAQRFGCSLSQQWKGPVIGFRLGVGLLYQVVSGRDLDDEKINDGRFLPSAELDFFVIL
jgi:hypothetical protein